jgi:multiple sugar transport system substrate-binding protein
MSSRSRNNSPNRGTTRRDFLKTVGVAAGAAGLAPAVSAPFISTAFAETKTLKILQWSHFIPEYDRWIDGFARGWGKKNGIAVTVDHIPHLELPARAAAEVSAGSGHDIFGFNGSGGPHLYAKHLFDLTSLVEEIEKKHGQVLPMGRQIAWNEETKGWSAFPDYFIDFPGLYRKDLWDEIGMKPDTWEDVRLGGAKLKQKGHPLGIALSHAVDPNNSYRSMLWSHGASICDETGKHVTLDSKETVEVVKFVTALYKEAMDPDVNGCAIDEDVARSLLLEPGDNAKQGRRCCSTRSDADRARSSGTPWRFRERVAASRSKEWSPSAK